MSSKRLPLLLPGHDWQQDAKCWESSDPELFWTAERETEAKTFCLGGVDDPACPVLDACLQYALAAHERYGVWGGTSERDRARFMDRIRHARRPA